MRLLCNAIGNTVSQLRVDDDAPLEEHNFFSVYANAKQIHKVGPRYFFYHSYNGWSCLKS